ncbi:heme A synthase [Hylemonella gracilis]|uniref:Heme A synthase n=1 Tax=Hylemonella gracilis TaxID=80880 RepID=A0A4P6UQ76_9BURK|nr:COX15/CtaA family protein [Hylemonella gracilis]QBK06305.1 heme A synthase [Hylemonella gracilis]
MNHDALTHTTLYDWGPVLYLMGLGLLIAAVPLAWLWLRRKRARVTSPLRSLQALTLLTLFLTFDLTLFGAFTRLSDSGLGCPDWPGCYGEASPFGARAQISAAQEVMPTGPVTHGKAWVEMIHRYLATGVGVLILVLAVATWWVYLRGRRSDGQGAGGAQGRWSGPLHPGWAMLTLFWVCVQGAFGALTVTMKLFPAIVTLHLLGALLLLALLSWQAVRYAQWHDDGTLRARAVAMPHGLRRALVLGLALLVLQIALGGWVSTNYAVLACTEFPLCQGSLWPDMDFAQGFEFWRALGKTAAGEHITFAALTAIHYAHRLVAYAVIVVLAWLAWRLRALPAWRRMADALAGVLLLQFLTGLSNVVLGWPLLAALLHTGGAAALLVLLVWGLASASMPAVVVARTKESA